LSPGVRMANCPKCDTNAEHPFKTWKIKQTPIALYECSSCKARWRSKLTVEAAVVPSVNPPETTTTGGAEVEAPLASASTSVAAAPSTSTSALSGIRRFFSSIFSNL